MAETVQYLVARADLGMSAGKLAAQCAHASSTIVLAFAGCQRGMRHGERLPEHIEAFRDWATGSFAKVVLRVRDRVRMDALLLSLDELALPHCVIRDACRTELAPEEPDGSTLTCIGIVPILRDRVPEVLQKLQVYQ